MYQKATKFRRNNMHYFILLTVKQFSEPEPKILYLASGAWPLMPLAMPYCMSNEICHFRVKKWNVNVTKPDKDKAHVLMKKAVVQ